MRALIAQAEENDNITTLFVSDDDGSFYGAIDLKDLIVARDTIELDTLVSRNFPTVSAHAVAAYIRLVCQNQRRGNRVHRGSRLFVVVADCRDDGRDFVGLHAHIAQNRHRHNRAVVRMIGSVHTVSDIVHIARNACQLHRPRRIIQLFQNLCRRIGYLCRMPDRMLCKAQHAQIRVTLFDIRPNLSVLFNIFKCDHISLFRFHRLSFSFQKRLPNPLYALKHLSNVTDIVVPRPSSLSSVICALCLTAICLTIASPRPVPPVALERLLSTR